MKIDKLLFGPAGSPHSSKDRSPTAGVEEVRNLGLGCMELEFVRQVFLKEDAAKELKEVAKKNNVILTSHAPYYINLTSPEKAKINASKKRIIHAAQIAWLAGAYSVTFHAAYYMGRDPEKIYEDVKKELKDIIRSLTDQGNKIWIRPETTGKPSQFGTVDEILNLSQELDQVMPCIDFSHLHARSGGKENTLAEFRQVLEKVEKKLGKKGLNNMHIHVSGINYTEKGERNHLNLKQSDLNYKDLINVFKEFRIKGAVISESPNLEDDALLLMRLYSN
ncbi:MAG: deoxyribonuclease IV [Candidatus Woesearchaeota archaeon]